MVSKITLIAVLFISFVDLYAGSDGLRRSIIEKQSGINTVSFAFHKKTRIKVTGDQTEVSGLASFTKPDLFRIVTKKPARQELVSDGEKRYFYSAKNKQVLVSASAGRLALPDFNSIIMDFTDNYRWEIKKELENSYLVRLSSGALKTSWEIEIEKETFRIVFIREERGEIVTEYRFSGIKESEEAEEREKYLFRIPKNTEVIEE